MADGIFGIGNVGEVGEAVFGSEGGETRGVENACVGCGEGGFGYVGFEGKF